jgi:hypothetical protein
MSCLARRSESRDEIHYTMIMVPGRGACMNTHCELEIGLGFTRTLAQRLRGLEILQESFESAETLDMPSNRSLTS